jgi:putative ABC transport system permease protein
MFMFATYALLEPGLSTEAFEGRLREALAPHFEDALPPVFAVALPSLYLSDLHTPAGFRGQVRYLYIFGFAALFVLLIAGINYINLATAQGCAAPARSACANAWARFGVNWQASFLPNRWS